MYGLETCIMTDSIIIFVKKPPLAYTLSEYHVGSNDSPLYPVPVDLMAHSDIFPPAGDFGSLQIIS